MRQDRADHGSLGAQWQRLQPIVRGLRDRSGQRDAGEGHSRSSQDRGRPVTCALPAPSDSSAGASYFERGGHKIEETIMSAERRTMRHLSYVGEWHTHPIGM
jgi:hypothetical protein